MVGISPRNWASEGYAKWHSGDKNASSWVGARAQGNNTIDHLCKTFQPRMSLHSLFVTSTIRSLIHLVEFWLRQLNFLVRPGTTELCNSEIKCEHTNVSLFFLGIEGHKENKQ